MPCNMHLHLQHASVQRASINKTNFNSDNAGFVCLPTGGKSCICVCENENGDIMQCDDCKCNNSDNCQCKCDDSKCTCIVTKGADCICVCRDARGNFKACDCPCNENKKTTCCKEEVTCDSCKCCRKSPEKETCGGNCKCDGRKNFKESARAMTVANKYKCDKAGCLCLPTGGKSCICVCEDDNGDIVRCDECKCNNSGKCHRKCDDSKCTCIVTEGADCICVCRDARGNIKDCNCSCNETKEASCCKTELNSKSYECCNKEPIKQDCGKNYKCDKAGCLCLPTSGKSCICVCKDDNGDIVRCDECKCNNSGNCQRNCDDSKCTCIVTKGADFICVCRDARGNFKACDCSCNENKKTTFCKEELSCNSCKCCRKSPEKETCGGNCKCDGRKNFKESVRAMTVANKYKCDKAGCLCLPTGGKSCICVCEDDNGDIVRCDECKCNNSGKCQRKCDDSKCTCIVTEGADCICVCRDARGNIKVCNCSCNKTKEASCCNKEPKKQDCGRNYKCDKAGCLCLPTGGKSCICVCEDDNGDIVRCDECKCNNSGNCQRNCDDSKCTCIVTKGADCICVCRDARGNFKACDCSCNENKKTTCCKEELTCNSCKCCRKTPEKETCGNNCKCDGNRDLQVSRRVVTFSKNNKCDRAGFVCLPTGDKSCICLCENENGDIIRCDDCKCNNSGNCQCKCDDSKCTCIRTKGAHCICVGRDGRGNIKTYDCCESNSNGERCCENYQTVKSCECCHQEPKKETCGTNCKCNGKRDFKAKKNSKPACMCCENTSGYKSLNNNKANEIQCCSSNAKASACCVNDRAQEGCNGQRGCICVLKETRYNRITDDGCVCVAKKSSSCICCY